MKKLPATGVVGSVSVWSGNNKEAVQTLFKGHLSLYLIIRVSPGNCAFVSGCVLATQHRHCSLLFHWACWHPLNIVCVSAVLLCPKSVAQIIINAPCALWRFVFEMSQSNAGYPANCHYCVFVGKPARHPWQSCKPWKSINKHGITVNTNVGTAPWDVLPSERGSMNVILLWLLLFITWAKLIPDFVPFDK